jgi:hypothetical protein
MIDILLIEKQLINIAELRMWTAHLAKMKYIAAEANQSAFKQGK